ncbi:ABC transporter permease [Deinococcus antarcticus]|jgi:peptide/nickel transport system permease protein|uniref:ABC transporter permease n=1 Tax=Deinococcus antarcticus TaxID=1298767 RepID=A0ABV8ACX7_9DEIO|nr:ABC transporter permease [Deinococcus ficus]
MLERIAQYLLVLVAAVSLNFFLPRAMPGSPLQFLAGEDVAMLPAAERQALLARTGLDQPLPHQYVKYVASLARGDLGYSYQANKPVLTMLVERLPWTILLTGSALLLSTLFGVIVGALAGWRRNHFLDHAAVSVSIFLDSVPTFWLGMMLVALFAVQWPLFPVFGALTPWSNLTGWAYVSDVAKHLVLPTVTLTLASLSGTFLVMRYSLLAELGEDYIRTARAKGVAERRVLYKHALRNASMPVFTVFMLNLGTLVGGAVVIETVFAYPGLGRMLFEAASNRDYPLLQGAFLLITLSILVSNVLADLVYPLLDPRVRVKHG